MATSFLDTSAIIKRYIFEQGQAWVLYLCNPAHSHGLYIAQSAPVEVVAAICRRAREQSISMAERAWLMGNQDVATPPACTGDFFVLPHIFHDSNHISFMTRLLPFPLIGGISPWPSYPCSHMYLKYANFRGCLKSQTNRLLEWLYKCTLRTFQTGS